MQKKNLIVIHNIDPGDLESILQCGSDFMAVKNAIIRAGRALQTMVSD